MKRFIVIVVLVLVIVGLIGVGAYFWVKRGSAKADQTASAAKAPELTFLDQDNQIISQRTDRNLAAAKIKAKAWKGNAFLVAYTLEAPIDRPSVTPSETFVFGSTDEPDNWWTISFSANDEFIRALIPKNDYLGQALQPIQESAWQKNYLEALNTAENVGGRQFRAENPEAQISILLTQSAPKDWLWWQIEYKAKANLKIRVSALDGRVFDEQGQPVIGNESNGQDSSTKSEIK